MAKREEIIIELSDEWRSTYHQSLEGVKALLLKELNANTAAIESLLMGYHYAEAGKVSDPVIKDSTIRFSDGMSGTFTIRYNTYFAMACSDKGYSNHNRMTIDFEINLTNRTLRLKGEYIIERIPDDF